MRVWCAYEGLSMKSAVVRLLSPRGCELNLNPSSLDEDLHIAPHASQDPSLRCQTLKHSSYLLRWWCQVQSESPNQIKLLQYPRKSCQGHFLGNIDVNCDVKGWGQYVLGLTPKPDWCNSEVDWKLRNWHSFCIKRLIHGHIWEWVAWWAWTTPPSAPRSW